MNKNEKFVITINRELGSGGRTVGRILAEKLGVPFYDKALVKTLEKEFDLSVEEIEKLKGRKHDWWSEFKRNLSIGKAVSVGTQYYQVPMAEVPDMLTTDEMFEAEKQILQGIAETESCVIAGRSGFFVFRNHPNHFGVLIQAPMEHRVNRVAQKQGIAREEAMEVIEKVDKMRERYVNKYTKTSRYDTRNYDLVINIDGKTEDEAADFILRYIG